MAKEERPRDDAYYERERVPLFSQGDLFRDVPLDYPAPPREIVVDEEADERGARAFLSGPLEFGPALLNDPDVFDARKADGGVRASSTDTAARLRGRHVARRRCRTLGAPRTRQVVR